MPPPPLSLQPQPQHNRWTVSSKYYSVGTRSNSVWPFFWSLNVKLKYFFGYLISNSNWASNSE
jgi:hypothetical protein